MRGSERERATAGGKVGHLRASQAWGLSQGLPDSEILLCISDG